MKYKEDNFSFNFNNRQYSVIYYGMWVLDGPPGYEVWLEESLVWNLYDDNDKEISNFESYKNIWIEAEKQLTLCVDHLNFNKEKI